MVHSMPFSFLVACSKKYIRCCMGGLFVFIKPAQLNVISQQLKISTKLLILGRVYDSVV